MDFKSCLTVLFFSIMAINHFFRVNFFDSFAAGFSYLYFRNHDLFVALPDVIGLVDLYNVGVLEVLELIIDVSCKIFQKNQRVWVHWMDVEKSA